MKLNGNVPAVLWIGEYLALPLETWASRPCLSQWWGHHWFQTNSQVYEDSLFLLLLTLLISVCLRSKGDQLSAEIFNDKDDLKFQSSREDTNIEYFLVAAGRSHLYLINEVRVETDPQDRTQLWIGLRELSYFTSVYPLLAATINFSWHSFWTLLKEISSWVILPQFTPF